MEKISVCINKSYNVLSTEDLTRNFIVLLVLLHSPSIEHSDSSSASAEIKYVYKYMLC